MKQKLVCTLLLFTLLLGNLVTQKRCAKKQCFPDAVRSERDVQYQYQENFTAAQLSVRYLYKGSTYSVGFVIVFIFGFLFPFIHVTYYAQTLRHSGLVYSATDA